MNKAELIDEVLSGSIDVDTKIAAGRLVDAVLEIISEELEKGEEVRLFGFGNFVAQVKPARNGRNPHTGESIEIPEKRVVKFKPAKALKDRVGY
jgi:DNA-binding protein HU-beta